MKGKIDKNGSLYIKRAEREIEWTAQKCPFVPPGEDTNYAGMNAMMDCGDWCPQFGEPQINHFPSDKPEEAYILICHGKILNFNKFIDERKMTEED